MPVDLYQDDFSRLTDVEVLQAVEDFTRLSEPVVSRPREGALLDFKESWSDSALHTVAGFAHGFGGLLFIGVSERDGQPDHLVGVEARGELKTSIASAIATNISPVPPYQIAECGLPSQVDRKLAIVRVRQGNRIYYITKKGDKPVYVRNEDQSVPADAAQLRSLIEGKGPSWQGQSRMDDRISAVRNCTKLEKTAASEPGPVPFLEFVLVPIDHPGMILDSSLEQLFRDLVSRNFSSQHVGPDVEYEEKRWATWYQYRLSSSSNGREGVWRVTSDGDVTYVGQVRARNEGGFCWSLGDTIVDLLLLLAVARSFWNTSGYYGEAHLLVSLYPYALPVLPDLLVHTWPPGPYARFQTNDFNSKLRGCMVSVASETEIGSVGTGVFNSGLPHSGAAQTVAGVMNQLLRSLGHGVDVSRLQSAVEHVLRHFG